MTKAELVHTVAAETGLTLKDTNAVLDALEQTITDKLAKGEKVQLIGFGSFEARHRAERKGRNPQTGEEITIPAGTVPAFRAGKALKEAVKDQLTLVDENIKKQKMPFVVMMDGIFFFCFVYVFFNVIFIAIVNVLNSTKKKTPKSGS